MKVKTIGYLAAVGMLCSSLGGWSLAGSGSLARPAQAEPLVAAQQPGQPGFGGAEFSTGKTLTLDARLGQSRLLSDKEGQTYVLVNVSAPAASDAVSRAALNLSIVIDRSGSMKGKRLSNAINAASGMIGRLRDGDVVSVVAYDSDTEVIVPSTTIDASSRLRAQDVVQRIQSRGETCISCGLEVAQQLLAAQSGMVNRILLLTDGEATLGIKDEAGFRSLAQRVRNAGASISSIGVDVNYNERVLAALAQESNGHHHFVESSLGLDRVFEAELESLTHTIAKDAELRVDLGPGVRVERVFDRSFRQDGSRLFVPLGTFAEGEQKTLLARVHLDRSAEGERPIANVKLAFSDTAQGARGECAGQLSLLMTRDAREFEPLDPLVLARVQRSETALALTEANQLFATGRGQLAQQRLANKLDDLRRERKSAALAAPKARARELESDFDRQEQALGAASAGFAEPPPGVAASSAPAKEEAVRKGKVQAKANQKAAVDLAF